MALDNPYKRLAFIGVFVGALCFIGVLLALPPVWPKTDSYDEWKDASPGQTATRTVTRIDVACADRVLGGDGRFAREFWVIDGVTSDNPYAALMNQDNLRSSVANLLETVDLTSERTARFTKAVAAVKKPCLGEYCAELLDSKSLEGVLRSCSSQVPQFSQRTFETHPVNDPHASRRSLWLGLAVAFSVVCLFGSVLYDATLAHLVAWVRFGRRR